jgi:hypothetical protein
MTRFLLFIVYLLSDINVSVIIFFTIDSEDIFPMLQSVQLVVDGGTSLGLILLFAVRLVPVNALYKLQKNQKISIILEQLPRQSSGRCDQPLKRQYSSLLGLFWLEFKRWASYSSSLSSS